MYSSRVTSLCQREREREREGGEKEEERKGGKIFKFGIASISI
jgi:hypothetical protein